MKTATLMPILLLTACSHGAVSEPTVDPTLQDVRSIAADAMTGRELPGLALIVMHEDDLRVAEGYGYAVPDAASTITAHTVFQLGSISKQFLSALVLRLVEEGQLSLDDPVTRYLPEFTGLPVELNVRHLLNHTSGIRELFTLPGAEAGFQDLTRSTAELEALVQRAPVDFEPSSRWSYSNTNYTILAFLVERILGIPYEKALSERLFLPLGLASMRQCASVPTGLDEARGHILDGGRNVPAPPENMNWIRGDGGLCGNAADLARWTRLLATGRVLTPSSYANMIEPTRLSDGRIADYGFGLSFVDLEGRRKIAHNGAMLGHSASAAYYPDSGLTVVVLVNRGDVRTESIERPVARRLLGLPTAVVEPQPLPEDQRRRLLGTYDLGVFDMHVIERDTRLWLEMPRPGPTTPLLHLGDLEFAAETDPDAYRVKFDDLKGPAHEVRVMMGGMHWYGRRRPR